MRTASSVPTGSRPWLGVEIPPAVDDRNVGEASLGQHPPVVFDRKSSTCLLGPLGLTRPLLEAL